MTANKCDHEHRVWLKMVDLPYEHHYWDRSVEWCERCGALLFNDEELIPGRAHPELRVGPIERPCWHCQFRPAAPDQILCETCLEEAVTVMGDLTRVVAPAATQHPVAPDAGA